MEDENLTSGTAEPTSPTHCIAETGEGSLLAQTVALVEERQRSELVCVDDREEMFEPAIVERKADGGVSVIARAEFDAYRSVPLYREGTAKLGDLDSLIGYINRFKDDGSTIFADDTPSAPSITAVLDYHRMGGPGDGGQRFGRHRAVHALPLSEEWKAWADLNGETISMPNFARFLEDHIVDVLPPGMIELSEAQGKFVNARGGEERIADPAKLMELATGLRVFEDSEVSQATNLQSGEGQLTVISRHGDGKGGQLIIPSMFVIAIPVFKHGEPYQIVVRLRYRKTGGGIVFVYELWRDGLVFDHAFNEAMAKVREGTSSLATFRGTPETSF